MNRISFELVSISVCPFLNNEQRHGMYALTARRNLLFPNGPLGLFNLKIKQGMECGHNLAKKRE